jgi:hypothetical protein
MSDSFVDSLCQLEDEFQAQSLSVDADARILRAMRQKQANLPMGRESFWWDRLFRRQFAWGAAVACLALLVGAGLYQAIVEHPENGTVMGGLLVVRGSVTFVERGALQCESSSCLVHFPLRRTAITLKKGGRILRKGSLLVWLDGRSFWKRVSEDKPLAVEVGGRVISFRSASFSIQKSQRQVTLSNVSGSIRVVSQKGHKQQLVAGRSVSWQVAKVALAIPPRPRQRSVGPSPTRLAIAPARVNRIQPSSRKRARTKVARRYARPRAHVRRVSPVVPMVRRVAPAPSLPKVRPVSPVAVKQTRPVPPVQKPTKAVIRAQNRAARALFQMPRWKAFLDEVERLRSQGRFGEALALLRKKIKTLRDPRLVAAQERLHYEMGVLLGHGLKQRRQACAHWRSHLLRYPHSHRYARDIRSHLLQLSCVVR